MSNPPSGYNTPKTNWQTADVVQPSDLNRIEGNINAIEQGARTLNQAQAPSGNEGSLRQILSWLANRIRAITGMTNWYDAPPTTLTAAKSHIDAAAPHSGHATTAALTAHTSAAAPHSGHETPAGAQAKVNGAEARAKAYTDQEVAKVSQALDAHKAAYIVVHGVARGTSTFAGQGNERAIAHGLGATPKAAYATPTVDPQGRLGEVWIRMTSTHLYVGNSGSFTGGMSWVAIL